MYNFELEIDHFYNWNMSNAIKSSSIVLWHALMHTWRNLGYPNGFTIAIKALSVKTGLEKSAIQRARNTLKQYGRIDWTERPGNKSAKYYINPFTERLESTMECGGFDAALSEPKSEPFGGPENEPQNGSVGEAKATINNNNLKAFIINDDDNDNNESVLRSNEQKAAKQQAFKRVQTYYEQSLGNLLSNRAYMKINELLDAGASAALICRAIDVSIDNGAKNWVYAERVVENCIAQGIFTLTAFEEKEAKRRQAAECGGNRNGGHSGVSAHSYPGIGAPKKKSKFANFSERETLSSFAELSRLEGERIDREMEGFDEQGDA